VLLQAFVELNVHGVEHANNFHWGEHATSCCESDHVAEQYGTVRNNLRIKAFEFAEPKK